MTDGIKVAQQGADVGTAPDYELIMSTEWSQLVIEAQGKFSVTNNEAISTLVPIYSHNLGYPPAFLIFSNTAYGFSPGLSNGQSQMVVDSNFIVDNNNLYHASDNTSTVIKGYFYIFKQNLLDTIQPKVGFQQPSQTQVVSKFGIDVATSNDSVNPTDLTSGSNLHPLAVHMMGNEPTDQVGSTVTTIVHNLGYPPIFLLYAASSGGYAMQHYRATFQPNSISYRGVQAPLPNPTYFIVAKDPVLQ